MLDDIIEELASWYIFCNQVQLARGLNDFIQLDDVWVAGQLEDLDLSSHSFNVHIFHNFVLFKDLHSHFFSSEVVCSKLDFAKSSLTNGLADEIMANALRLVLPRLLAALVPCLGMMPIFGIRCLILFICIRLFCWPTLQGIFVRIPAYCASCLQSGFCIIQLIA